MLSILVLAAPVRAEEAPTAPLADVEGPVDVRVSGLLQIDGVLHDQASEDQLDPDTGQPLNRERIAIQRAWLRAEAVTAYVRGLVVLEATTQPAPALRLLAAELSVFHPRAPWFELTAGQFLIPFGLETAERVDRRMFLEASTWVAALFPGRRDLGLRARGTWSFLNYALAVMNGNPIASASLPLRDPNRAKDVLGRLGVEGPLTPWLQVALGASGLMGHGFHAGAAPTEDSFVVRDVNADGIAQPDEIQIIAGTPGERSRNFGRRAWAADLSLVYRLPGLGTGRVYGELVWATNLDRALFVADPIATGRDARELGAMGALRQSLTRHVELGVRYDRYDPGAPARENFSTLGAALAWCTLPYLRVTLQYDHRFSTPTPLSADTLILRGQLEI